ncbi:MAG: hypothetical protein HY907_00835 [Deltaproteobacteria bacterium]|nr:hypothetical protein [Deltaproteobacteria bacterium]
MRKRFAPAALLAGLWLACGPASNGAEEPVPPPPRDAESDAGVTPDVPAPPPDAPPAEVGPLPGPPGADPPGFEPYEPLPESLSLTRVLWKLEGVLVAENLREGVDTALRDIATCLETATAGGRLPMHLIIEASGRVVEVGAPLVDEGLRDAITCAQLALRALRFPESTGDTTVHLILER